MSAERAVVLSQGSSGLRLSGWLARRGVAVRHLGLGPLAGAPPGSVVVGERSVLEPWLGPAVAVDLRRAVLSGGRLLDLGSRRRELARFAGGTVVGLMRDLRPRVLRPSTVGTWGVATLGSAAWEGIFAPLLGKLLGGDVADLPARLAGLWVSSTGARGWSCAGHDDVEAVLEAGGEPLEEVEVEGIEVDGERVVAVATEFGREHVDAALYTDLAPARVAELLPAGLVPAGEVAALRSLRATDTAMVEIGADAADLPHETWLADPEVPVLRVLRAGDDRVQVEVIDRGDGDERLRTHATGGLAGLARVREVGSVRRRPGAWPRPATDPAALRALERLQRLGIVGVGGRALHLPLSPSHEARIAAAWAAARTPAGALAELLTAPRSVRGRALLP